MQHQKSKRQITEEKENFQRHTYIWELLTKYCKGNQYSGYFKRMRHRIDKIALYLLWFKALFLATITKLPLSNIKVVFTIGQLHLCLPENSLLDSWFAFLTFGLETSWNVVEWSQRNEFLQQRELTESTQSKGPWHSFLLSTETKSRSPGQGRNAHQG